MIKIKDNTGSDTVVISASVRTLTRFIYFLIDNGFNNSVKQINGNEFVIDNIEKSSLENLLEEFIDIITEIDRLEEKLEKLKVKIS